MKIALLNVVLDGDYQYIQEVPLGILSIASFLRGKEYPVEIHQCFASKKGDIDRMACIQADVYGFQLTMVNFSAVRAVINRLKATFPGATVTVGGPFLSMLYAEIMENEKGIDSIVIGEGEFTMLEYLKALGEGKDDFSHIDGLVWRGNNAKIVVNPFRKPLETLDDLPFPARDFLENGPKDPIDGGLRESVRVCTSRGCVGKCSFCCVNLYSRMYKGKRWRGRSAGHVVDEIEYLIKNYKVRLFNFSDSSFEDPGAKGKRRAQAICEEIIRRNLQLSAKVYMRCETMKTEGDLDLLRLYKRSGIDVIIIGAEAGSDYELEIYEKHAHVEDNFRTARMLKELDMFYVLVGFIMFGPYTNELTLRSNIEFLHKSGLSCSLRALTNVLMLVKASKLYQRLKAENRVVESRNYWEQPEYIITDPVGRRMSRLWQNMFSRYPAVLEMDALQINIGNLVARMTNPMNRRIFERFSDEFVEFKQQYRYFEEELGKRNYEHFLDTLEAVKVERPDRELDASFHDFFALEYEVFNERYRKLYTDFLGRISEAGFGLSGLVFKHFTSAMSIGVSQRVSAMESVPQSREKP